MKFPMCVACGSMNDLHHHHLVPRTMGGGDEETNLVTLCTRCHSKLHNFKIAVDHGKLVSAGIERAKREGTRLGPKAPKYTDFRGSYGTRTPVEEVWIRLFTHEGINAIDLCRLTWADVSAAVVKLPFREVTLTDDTRKAVAEAVKFLNLDSNSLSRNITASAKRPGGINPGYLSVKLHRLKDDAAVKRKGPPGKDRIRIKCA